ncbi:MAG: M18 family aminopeptidase [Chlamydiae bacterium CG10_big_fil_rev_8_21_14_0_10_42_34]|nr:MAG: M18 family aminopeptidase [Chlamydiae bacterium CG10_big_fil_rev_8_21_14_0_10_42_34]
MTLGNFVQFLNRSPTVYHAAKEVGMRLAEADFTPLSEGEKWTLEPGKGYFVTREDSLVAAFRLPKKKPQSAILHASHLDSPALKIKPRPEISSQGIGQFGTEIYGGPLLHTWLDRDLALAGRIVVANKNGQCETKLVFLDDYPLIIPGIAIHLQRDINEKGTLVHKQDHLKAIYSIQTKENHLDMWLKKHHSFHELLSFDLFLVPLERAALNGFEDELISSYRLDNLTSAFASLDALLNSKATEDTIQMAIFWDHEEIGSKTYGGADSLFVDQMLERICMQNKMDREDLYRLKSRSLCISCDVGHAFHPNFPEKYDTQNAPLMGKGPVVKFSSRYATNGPSAAPIVHLAKKNKIPLQTSASRSDLSGGGTVGAMMGANLGIQTVDIGLACWAMHSIRETVSTQDLLALAKLLKVSFEKPLISLEQS